MKSGFHLKVSRFLRQYEVDESKYRIVPMEGLRGFAVLLVFFVHFHALFGETLAREGWSHRTFEFLGTIGNAGVDLFFVMSGFLIYGAIIRRKTPYLSFLRRRIERIYPTFLAVFAVYLLLSLLFPVQNKIHGSPVRATIYVLENLFLLPGIFKIQPIITVAWSLSYEFFFYLALPLVVSFASLRTLSSRSRVVALYAIWIGFACASLYAGIENRTRMISFVSGMLLYEITASAKLRGRLGRLGEGVSALAIVGGFLLFYIVHRPRSHSSINPFVPIMVLSACFFLLALYSFELQGFFAWAFSWAPLRFLGNMSYSYYLIHGLTLQAFAYLLQRSGQSDPSAAFVWTVLPIAFAATWAASSVLFMIVEKPCSLSRRSANAKSMVGLVESSKSANQPSHIDLIKS